MIIRILGEGQFDVADEYLDELNVFDTELQEAADGDDELRFAAALRGLLDAVRRHGRPLAPERITPSDLVLPYDGTSLERVREMLSDEGLVPG